MSTERRLSEVFAAAPEIPFDDASKLILLSDCHRGDNSWADDLAHNQHLLFFALRYYLEEGFTYIELGDADELYENRYFAEIRSAHSHIFWLMREFYLDDRLYLIWGNHDAERMSHSVVEQTLYYYEDERTGTTQPLFEGITVHEGLVLRHADTGSRILLVHGHQGDLINDALWRLGRFMVRCVWRHAQLFGVKDLTRPAKNYRKRYRIEQKLGAWVRASGHMLIAGHTHRPQFPDPGDLPYFNDGSCVHPRCITGIEIQEGQIALIKWWVKAREDSVLAVAREILAGPRPLTQYA